MSSRAAISKRLALDPALPKWGKYLPNYIREAVRAYGYDIREYQAEAAIRTFRSLIASRNVEICLPPGTGKTLIGQMVASLWLNRRNGGTSRVLCIVPNTNLLQQHYAMSDWAYQARLWEPLKIDTEWRRKKRGHDIDLRDNRVWFSLAKQFANAVNNDDVTREFLETVSLVVVDEYDAFSKAILEDEPDAILEFKRDMVALREALKEFDRAFLFISATPPKKKSGTGNASYAGASVWEKWYAPKLIQIPRCHYTNYVPVARVTPVGIEDGKIFIRDTKIKKAMAKQIAVVRDEILAKSGHSISFVDLIFRIDSIIKTKRIKVKKNITVALSKRSVDACREYQALKFYRLCVFEDLGGDGQGDYERLDFASQWSDLLGFEEGAKFRTLVSLLNRELKKSNRIVVFLRYVNTVCGVAEALNSQGIENGYVFGEQDIGRRSEVLRDFKIGNKKVLLASRELFGRGFDLPEADVAVFYSPKDNVRTIWQEFLRIRATLRDPKHVYLFFYLWTAEADKMKRLLQTMWKHGAERKRGRYWWRYEWDFTEDFRAKGTKPDDFSFFDWTAQEGAFFWNNMSNAERSTEEHDDEGRDKQEASRTKNVSGKGSTRKAVTDESPIKRFSQAFATAFSGEPYPWNDQPRSWLYKVAQACGLTQCYRKEPVEALIRSLTDALSSDSWKKAQRSKNRKRALLICVHPDHHHGLSDDYRQLYTEVTACFIDLL